MKIYNYLDIYKNQIKLKFLGIVILSLLFWSFWMNISLVIVIVFSFLEFYVVCKPLANLYLKIEQYFRNKWMGKSILKDDSLSEFFLKIIKVIIYIVIFFVSKFIIEFYLKYII